jgi:hypothetical protein
MTAAERWVRVECDIHTMTTLVERFAQVVSDPVQSLALDLTWE